MLMILTLPTEFSETDRIYPRILIVDDDMDACVFYKTCLEDGGFQVVIYNDPLKALSSFKPRYYDLILIVIRMPKMNGFDLYTRIRNIDQQTKMCFITAFEEYYIYLKEQFPKLDAQCFIKKPVKADELIARIMSELTSHG